MKRGLSYEELMGPDVYASRSETRVPRAPGTPKAPGKGLPKGDGGKGGGGTPSGGGDKTDQYRNRSAANFKKQAQNLEGQAAALRLALNKTFRKSLNVRLSNVNRIARQQQGILVDGYKQRYGSLKENNRDNEAAEGTQSAGNASNRLREGQNALTEAMVQGAGESDKLRAQGMSLRAWQANQGEVSRSYYDSNTSTNSALTDLNVDTKQARYNVAHQALSDKESLWTDYYNRRSETQTQLGNIYGQMADLYGNANEMNGGKGTAGSEKGAAAKSKKAFMDASKTAGQAWKNPGVSKKLKNWEGKGPFEASDNISKIYMGASATQTKAPEGATLREWRA